MKSDQLESVLGTVHDLLVVPSMVAVMPGAKAGGEGATARMERRRKPGRDRQWAGERKSTEVPGRERRRLYCRSPLGRLPYRAP